MKQRNRSGGGGVRDTSGEPVADNTDEEQQLIEGRSYGDAVAKGKERKVRVVKGDSVVRKLDKIIKRGDDVTVCLPGAKIEDVTERVGKVMGNGYGGSILLHVGTNNAVMEGTTAIIEKYRKLVCTLKGVRVGQIVLSGILPIMGSRGKYYKNCRRMTIYTSYTNNHNSVPVMGLDPASAYGELWPAINPRRVASCSGAWQPP